MMKNKSVPFLLLILSLMFPLSSVSSLAETSQCEADGETVVSDSTCEENSSIEDKLLGQQLISMAVNTKVWNKKEISKVIDNIHAIYEAIGLNKDERIDAVENYELIDASEIYPHQKNKIIITDKPIDISFAENCLFISSSDVKISHSMNNIIVSNSNIKISHSTNNIIVSSKDVSISSDGVSKPEGSVILAKGLTKISNALNSVIYSVAGVEVSNSKNVKVYNASYIGSGNGKVEESTVAKIF